MDLCYQSCLFVQLAVHLSVFLTWQKLNIGHNPQSTQPIFFIPAMLIGSTDFYHFIPLVVTLTLAGGLKVSAKQNLLASFSQTLFI